jgi:hypothetical protein
MNMELVCALLLMAIQWVPVIQQYKNSYNGLPPCTVAYMNQRDLYKDDDISINDWIHLHVYTKQIKDVVKIECIDEYAV